MCFKALPVKIQRSKNRQGVWGRALRPPPLSPGHIGLIDLLRSSDCLKTVTCYCSSLVFDKKADNSNGNSSENFAF